MNYTLTLKRVMEGRQMTAKDVSWKSGVCLATIYQIARGEVECPQPRTVGKLKKAFWEFRDQTRNRVKERQDEERRTISA